ncbi:fungal zn(2)-Cys(6) binuclear cluster domain-containing protein [Sarocladium implicatum]|nr:fungal zn(2)-Cys(6) binuclear cluster domain-containing protein [Sarocladium implicatum]
MSSSNTQKRSAPPPKVLARLLPAPSTASEDQEHRFAFEGSPHTLIKRPRIGVPIACNFCRLKKTRCDGGKPSCVHCERKGQTCVYENANIKGAKNGDLLLEATGLLSSLTPSQAIATLLSLSEEVDATVVINSIRIAADHASRHSDGLADITDMRFFPANQLSIRHPFTYPENDNAGSKFAGSLLRELLLSVQSGRQGSNRSEDPYIRDLSGKSQNLGIELPPRPQEPLVDSDLETVDISQWTEVPISSELGIRAITLYLDSDHVLLSPFHKGFFIRDLVSGRTDGDHCSTAMVNALLYWCCQMYSSVEVKAAHCVENFRLEAQRLLEIEVRSPRATTMVTAMFLGLGHLVQGKDHFVIHHLTQAKDIGIKLGLFGKSEDDASEFRAQLRLSERVALAYPCWGVFNWIVMMTLFYRQRGVTTMPYYPTLDMPDPAGTSKVDEADMETEPDRGIRTPSSPRDGDIFIALCRFWRIMHDVVSAYYGESHVVDKDKLSLQFAEFKFRELLAWTDEMPLKLARSGKSPHQVVILHLWLHSAILDIFRPFLKREASERMRLRTFAAPMNTPDAAYAASVEQLKRLVVIYRAEYTASHYTIIWHTSLLYTANAMLHSTDEDRLLYFLICVYSYEGLSQAFRITEAMVRALLSMALQNGVITAALARRVLRDLHRTAPRGHDSEELIRAPFIADLDEALSAPDSATVESYAATYEENALLRDYTSLFDVD